MTDSAAFASDNAVFRFRKLLGGERWLTCTVMRMPDHRAHRVGYAFELELSDGSVRICRKAEITDCTAEEAERLFNLICVGNVHPDKLSDLVRPPHISG